MEPSSCMKTIGEPQTEPYSVGFGGRRDSGDSAVVEQRPAKTKNPGIRVATGGPKRGDP